MSIIKIQMKQALEELLETAHLKPDHILVVGCSTSEVLGYHIGKHSSLEVADAILNVLLPVIKEKKLYLAVQCCEHLNRALLVEETCASKYNLDEVAVIPHERAGGSLATRALELFDEPVVVESIQAHAGIDIGDTFIGMHLKPVVVPVRALLKEIGQAHLTMARTRPKYIGGPRAQYGDLTVAK
ncbi:TIGR01440 family protein [Syntrophomonas erecta]